MESESKNSGNDQNAESCGKNEKSLFRRITQVTS